MLVRVAAISAATDGADFSDTQNHDSLRTVCVSNVTGAAVK